MSRSKIIGIGEIVWDMLPEGRQLGGAPVNFAYYAGQLGAEASVISAVGRDDEGRDALARLDEAGIDRRMIQVNDLPTSKVLVTLEAAGIPRYEIVEGVAWDDIRCTEEALAHVSDADAVCWGSLAQRSEGSRKAMLRLLDAAPAGALKVFDINIRQHYYSLETIRESLRRADVLKVNEEELPLVAEMLGLPQSGAEIARACGLKYLIHTCGARFSEVYDQNGLISRLPTPDAPVKDTVGAGDSFTAVFMTGLLKGKTVAECHAKAVAVSTFVCTQHGAVNPLPPAEREF